MNRIFLQFTAILLLTFSSCNTPSKTKSNDELPGQQIIQTTQSGPLSSINVPDGFKIEIWADNVPNARSMVMTPDGTLFVSTRNKGSVYALRDTNGDNRADQKFILVEGLNMPNGVAYKDKALYVAEVDKLWRYDNIEDNLASPPKPELIYDDYPKDYMHGWKVIAFGPDGKLYVPVGTPCNVCESKNEMYATITRMDPDGSNREVYAKGVRNTVGFTWHPETDEMWFTDNGRDHLGDNFPPCELNRVSKVGQHFGYPYCHGGDIADPEFGHKKPCTEFEPPAQKLGAHVAPLGVKFYTGSMFPQEYKNVIFIAEHGSWNRSKKIGYRISMVREKNGKGISYETFIDGWLDQEKDEACGRPVDVLIIEDGSMLISDDKFGAIYRVTYSG